jgi:hypothetical protein
MYIIIAIMVYAIVAGAVKLIRSFKGKSVAKASGLCSTCVNVYNVKGYGGKELVFCNYTSELRAIKFVVCECTGYRSKNIVPLTRIVGFAPFETIDREEAFLAVAIRIGRD